MRWLVWLGVAMASCRGNGAEPVSTERSAPTPAVAEFIYRRGLQGEWRDYGWADHGPDDGGVALLDFTNKAGWILANKSLKGRYGGVVVRFSAPATKSREPATLGPGLSDSTISAEHRPSTA